MTCAYGVNALTDEILAHLQESRIRRVVLMLDADDAGREAALKFAEKLSAIGIESRTVDLPAKDASEFVVNGGTLEAVQRLIEPQRRGDGETAETRAAGECAFARWNIADRSLQSGIQSARADGRRT
ncbi:MAG: toprim domain-containing protein [Ignavibacteria bacterium]|nr:toprim domain-containing protein [Ignavibacteria bacterium]